MNSYEGKLIIFEGGDGGGKGTQIQRLKEDLEKQYGKNRVVVSHEPGGGIADYRQKLFDFPKLFPNLSQEERNQKELELFIEDRRIHVRDFLWPMKRAGRIILEDRFAYSTVAYQGYGRGMDIDKINSMNEKALNGLAPGLIVLMDIDPAIGLERKYKNQPEAQNRFEKEEADFHQRVREGFLAQAVADTEHWIVIDASRDEETISREIREIVRSKLGI